MKKKLEMTGFKRPVFIVYKSNQKIYNQEKLKSKNQNVRLHEFPNFTHYSKLQFSIWKIF
jgi:hypothetical protein